MIRVLLTLYIFISVNDLILYALNFLQLKNLLLAIVVLCVSVGCGPWKQRQVTVLYFLIPLVSIPLMIGLISGVSVGSILQQIFSVIVAVLFPVIVDRYADDDHDRWRYVANVLLFSLVCMMLFKVVFVIYQSGYIANAVLDFLFRNILGRGEIDGIARLNTGTQLLMLYGLLLCVSRVFTALGRERLGYLLVCVLFALDLFITSSRFFSVAAPVAVVVTLLFGRARVSNGVLLAIGLCVTVVAIFLLQDIYTARVAVGDSGDTIRQDQISALIAAFNSAPVFGHGAGYALPGLLRSDETPFLYEVQVIAFLMQFGVVGGFLYVAAMFKTIKPHLKTAPLFLVIFYLFVFFAASYFNPYMLGSYAAMCMVVIVILVRGFTSDKVGVVR